MNGTAYVAGKWGVSNVVEVRRIQNLLLDECGLECEFDWTRAGAMVNSQDGGSRLARQEARAALEADVFVLVWHPKLLGGLIELGLAAAAQDAVEGSWSWSAARVFVYAGPGFRDSIFWWLPGITVVDDDDELIREVKKCL